MIKQGANAQPVPSQKQGPGPGIPQGKGKLSVEMSKHTGAKALIQMNQNLGICLGIELVSHGYQQCPEFRVVEDFAIENQPDGFVFIMNGLISTGKINDAQADAAKACRALGENSCGIGGLGVANWLAWTKAMGFYLQGF